MANRIEKLASHLAPVPASAAVAAPLQSLKNIRPGDEDANPVKTSFFIKGGFRPVIEEISTDLCLSSCCIEGKVPAALRGTFLRIGPNPRFDFQNKPYHVFDGDGMIHKVKFAGDGTAHYQNKWVRTITFEHEAAQGFSFAMMGEGMQINETGSFAFLQHVPPSFGRANTAITWNAPQNKLLALYEADRPYAVDIETLDTTDYMREFGGRKLPFPTFTAHPKVCPITGDMFFFGYINRDKPPFLHYGVIDGKSGELVRAFPIDIPCPVMMHDITITKNYVIFYDYNNKFYSPAKVMAGEAEAMYVHDVSIPARFGVLPRMATSDKEIIWIDAKHSLAVFHFANAWEEGNCIRIYGAANSAVDLDTLDEDTSGGHLHVWRLDLARRECVEDRDVDTKNMVDFMQVPPSLIGQKTRYVYATGFTGSYKVNGIVKFDLDNETFVKHRFDTGKIDDGHPDGGVYGGENMFAVRGADGEDDGWLIGFTFGDKRCPSSVDILDAKSMEMVARVALPQRVPVGFHAYWKPEL